MYIRKKCFADLFRLTTFKTMSLKQTLKRKLHVTPDADDSWDDFEIPNKMSRPQIKILDLQTRIHCVEKMLKTFNMKGIVRVEDLKPLDKNDHSPLFVTYRTKNDGNSFYRSISYLLFENEDYHQFVRNALIKSMRLHKTVMNKYCQSNTTFKTIDHYIEETRADAFGRLPNVFIEMQALAHMFSIPVYLFTKPITIQPTKFSIPSPATNSCAFVLYMDMGYIRPVLKFDSEEFKHHVNAGFGSQHIGITNGEVTVKFQIDTLNSISTTLCKEAVEKIRHHVYISTEALNMLEYFANFRENEIRLHIHLFNFACENGCYSLVELLIRLFKSSKSVKELADFLDKMKGQSKKHFEELVEYFRDICCETSLDKVCDITANTIAVSNILKAQIEQKQNLVLSTKFISVQLDDNTFAFKDKFPFTVLCLNNDKKTIQYYSGPKPHEQKWVDISLNRRFAALLDRISSPDHILFVKESVYMFIEGERLQIAFLSNVFKSTQPVELYVLPKSTNPLTAVQMVLTDSNSIVLVDKTTKQVFDLSKRKWIAIENIITVSNNDDYEMCTICLTGDTKQTVLLRKPRSESVFGFDMIYNIKHIPSTPFQYTLSKDFKEVYVQSRLADDKIRLDPATVFQEQEQLLHKVANPFVHYVIPKANANTNVYALIDTDMLNRYITSQQQKQFQID